MGAKGLINRQTDQLDMYVHACGYLYCVVWLPIANSGLNILVIMRSIHIFGSDWSFFFSFDQIGHFSFLLIRLVTFLFF